MRSLHLRTTTTLIMDFLKFNLNALSKPQSLDDVEALAAELALAVEELALGLDQCFASLRREFGVAQNCSVPAAALRKTSIPTNQVGRQ